MGRKDPRVDAYIAKSAPFAKPILTHIRKAVHAGCPDVEEDLKWGCPAFMHKGILCGMAAFKEHCRFGFWKPSLVGEAGSGAVMSMNNTIRSVADLPSAAELQAMVRKAAALNEEGVKMPRRKAAPKPALRTPPDLMKRLRANKRAQAAFEAFSPSHRREYIEWITGAKAEETRQRRLETAVEWIAEGKGRNWKYERKNAAPRQSA